MNSFVCITKKDESKEWIELTEDNIGDLKNLPQEDLKMISINIRNFKGKYDINFEELAKFSVPITIKYGDNLSEKLPLQDFITYSQKLKKMKNAVIKDEMSPFEKLLAAYQFVIKFSYKGYPAMGSAHNFVDENRMGVVCEDYCSFIREALCNEANITAEKLSVEIIEGDNVEHHAELIVKIDDDKYDIHGLYLLDPTNDSYVEDWKNYFGEDFAPGELFDRFMMPLNSDRVYNYSGHDIRIQTAFTDADSYKIMVEGDTEMLLSQSKEDFGNVLETISDDNASSYSTLMDEIGPIINAIPLEDRKYYTHAKEVPFENIASALTNVMHLQGYDEQKISESITRVMHNYALSVRYEDENMGSVIR